ncbi:hypothetical protein H6F76_02390 [Leptolyngbya sp. FACHB-321]|uniref:hypothetical protein n=1 Tax=Leptolyngbya sp. FACHB-321 TaxID=2692807 RepID=UPI0016838493|nr:hypothetical protein [Leptolyngbya sp. FACHB-321]MBD2033902.1 hypothetical protein [Leptolyngbya sp. FACHB-321]
MFEDARINEHTGETLELFRTEHGIPKVTLRAGAPTNARELLVAFEEHQRSSKGRFDQNHETTVLRYAAPGWSGQFMQGRKATEAEIQTQLKALEAISIEQFCSEAESIQEAVFERTQCNKRLRSKYKCLLQQQLEWARAQWFVAPESMVSSPPRRAYGKGEGIRLCRKNGERRPQMKEHLQGGRTHTRPLQIGLSSVAPINDTLNEQFRAFRQFLITPTGEGGLGVALSTADEITLPVIRRIFGYLHLEQGHAWEDLRLETIISVFALNPDPNLFLIEQGKRKGELNINRYANVKATAIVLAEEDAKKVLHLLKNYFTYDQNHPGTNLIACKSMIHLAKFLYREQTNRVLRRRYEDVPVITGLRVLQNDQRDDPGFYTPTIPNHQRTVPWEDAIEVIRQSQHEAEVNHTFRVNKQTGKEEIKRLRARRGRAEDIQRLLILLLLMVSGGPDRPRTLGLLRIGETFLYGDYDGLSFTSADRMRDPSQASWWIHLLPHQYKNGRTRKEKGEFWARVPDSVPELLSEGKTLYYYLYLWLNEYRAYMNPQHDFLLTTDKGQPFNPNSVADRISARFFKFTRVRVTSTGLRKMYVTFLQRIKAPKEVMVGARVFMKHAEKMQTEIYSMLEDLEKMEHLHTFNADVQRRFFKT